jgi:hypothetical protein
VHDAIPLKLSTLVSTFEDVMLTHPYTISAGIIAVQISQSRREGKRIRESCVPILRRPHDHPSDPLCSSFLHAQPSISGLGCASLYTQSSKNHVAITDDCRACKILWRNETRARPAAFVVMTRGAKRPFLGNRAIIEHPGPCLSLQQNSQTIFAE